MDEGANSDDDDRVLEWEFGLPTATDLTPLSHLLISPELASAFSITAEPFQTMLDVNRASQNTLSSLRKKSFGFSSNNFKVLSSFMEGRCSDPDPEPIVVDYEESDLAEKRKIDCVEVEEADSIDDSSARTLKRARLVWTPHLHKRFVDVVTHLGIDNVVPKTIVQLMNVEGLTRENVASHLQKYRLYLKRKHEGDSCNDQLFVSLKSQKELNIENRNIPLLPLQHGAMPMVGVSHGNGNMGVPVHNSASGSYNRYQIHPYNSMYREPHRQ